MIKEKKLKQKNKVLVTISYLLMAFFAICILAPFYVVLITSFKHAQEASNSTIMFTYWPKQGFTLEAYVDVLFNDYTISSTGFSSILIGFKNTLMILVPPAAIGLFSSSLAGYSFAKLEFRGKKLIFTILISTMMIPGTLTMVPAYMWYNTLGWIGTVLPLIVHACFGGAVATFFMRQYYSGIPTDLVEAASLDGLGSFMIFIKIMIPLSVPALIAQGVLSFVSACNAYLGPLIYIQSQGLSKFYTLQIALKNFQLNHMNDYPLLMAATIIALIPELLIYMFGQRYFVEGIATTGIKL